MDGPSERVRITSPLTSASPHVRRTVREEIDQSTVVGEVYIRSLMRSQLRTALSVVAVLMGTVGALPLAFVLSERLVRAQLLGIPLPWLLLGIGVYPVLVALGWFYVQRAARTERDFARLVEPGQ
jgi:putative solute:sodium symporter small subunit